MTTPINSTDRHITLAHRAQQLEERYPGIRCQVEFHEFAPGKWLKGHALWEVRLYSDSLECLVKHGLATAERFEFAARALAGKTRDRDIVNSFGDRISFERSKEHWIVHTYVTDYCNEEKPFTKKLRADVARMLKRFARATDAKDGAGRRL